MILPPEARPLVAAFVFSFTSPTYQRFSTLLVGALLTTGRRTVANLLRTLRHLAPGHRTDYQRVLSRAPWSGLELGCTLMRLILDRLIPDGPIALVGDDTVDGHKGPKVYGKARHRDAVRSTRSYTAWRYGHTWVVLAVLVKFPFAARPWALPVLIDLYRSKEDDTKRNRWHRTPARIMCGLLRLLLIRFPNRSFVFAGDSGYGTHEVARFCYRHRARLALVSKRHPDANRFDPPPPYAGKGRPRVKGTRRPKPRAAVAAATAFTRLEVGWYGGGKRRVDTLDGTGHGYKSGAGLVSVRWVFVRDTTGTHRDEYFFTTDPELTPSAVIGHYCGRWDIETTFQESRSALGLETTRGWREKTVLRAGPCLLGLYAVVAILFHDTAPSRSDSARCRGPVRQPSRSLTPCAPSAGGSGTRPFCHRRVRTRPSINCPPLCGNCSSPRSHPLPEQPESASVLCQPEREIVLRPARRQSRPAGDPVAGTEVFRIGRKERWPGWKPVRHEHPNRLGRRCLSRTWPGRRKGASGVNPVAARRKPGKASSTFDARPINPGVR